MKSWCILRGNLDPRLRPSIRSCICVGTTSSEWLTNSRTLSTSNTEIFREGDDSDSVREFGGRRGTQFFSHNNVALPPHNNFRLWSPQARLWAVSRRVETDLSRSLCFNCILKMCMLCRNYLRRTVPQPLASHNEGQAVRVFVQGPVRLKLFSSSRLHARRFCRPSRTWRT